MVKAGDAGAGLWAAIAVGALLLDTRFVCAFLGPSPIPLSYNNDGKSGTMLKAPQHRRLCPKGAPGSRTTLFSRGTGTIDDEIKEATTSVASGAVKQSSGTSPKVADGYYLILFLCFFVTFLSALDRVAMSVALVPMSEEFAFTDSIKGQISSVFSVGYGLCILPCGLLVAAASPRLIMASGVGLWSLATIGTPIAAGLILISEGTAATTAVLAENVVPLLAVRAVMGGAESVVLPAVQRILANWVPPDKKSLAVASVLSGFQLGTVCAYLLSPIVIERFGGWRGMFYLYGSVGILWLIPWLFFVSTIARSNVVHVLISLWFRGDFCIDICIDHHLPFFQINNIIYQARDLPSVNAMDIEHTSEDEEEIVLMNTLQDDDMSLVPEHVIFRSVVDETPNSDEASNESPKKKVIVEPELPSPFAFEEAVAVFREAPWKELATSKAVWAMVSLYGRSHQSHHFLLSFQFLFLLR